MPISMVATATVLFSSLRRAWYVSVGLAILAVGPILFIVVDHVIVTRWVDGILDFVSGGP